jgi:apolipoprotein N-acyltransferase
MIDYFSEHPLITSAAAGVLLGLSFPPFDLPILIIPAFYLFLLLCEQESSYRRLMARSYLGFLIWNVIVTYWLMMATFAGGIAAILANSVLMTFPLALIMWIRRQRYNPLITAFLSASSWLTYEYLHHHWDLSWPWLTLGNAWSVAPPIIQFISVTGFWGLSFWMIFAASLMYDRVHRPKHTTNWSLALSIILLPAISLPLWFSHLAAEEDASAAGSNRATIGVIQPNFDSYLNYGGFSSATQSTEHLLSLTDSLRAIDSLDAVYWPENAIEPNVRSIFRQSTTRMIQDYVRKYDLPVVGGATYYDYYQDGDQAKPALVRKSSRGLPYLYFNSAVSFYPDRPMKVYKKAHLVPIVERTPFLSFLNALPLGIDWTTIPWYGKGYEPTVFRLVPEQDIVAPALVCYDSVYPDWNRQMVNRGATFIGIITNDGWWGHTSGHIQHFQFARLRAIELDRWIVRSANNGISGFIAPSGRIIQQTPYWKATGIAQNIELKQTRTLYAQWGDWLPYLSLISIFGFVVGQFFNLPGRIRSLVGRHSVVD